MRLEIQWIDVEPGKVFIGSDNRSVLFGGIGPRHEVKIDYNFEISFVAVVFEKQWHKSKLNFVEQRFKDKNHNSKR